MERAIIKKNEVRNNRRKKMRERERKKFKERKRMHAINK
jgi:hypothetical protein